MEETFIGGRGSIRDGRKSLSLKEVAQKVEQLSQRREVSSSDPTTSPRTAHEVISSLSFDDLLKILPKVDLRR